MVTNLNEPYQISIEKRKHKNAWTRVMTRLEDENCANNNFPVQAFSDKICSQSESTTMCMSENSVQVFNGSEKNPVSINILKLLKKKQFLQYIITNKKISTEN